MIIEEYLLALIVILIRCEIDTLDDTNKILSTMLLDARMLRGYTDQVDVSCSCSSIFAMMQTLELIYIVITLTLQVHVVLKEDAGG